MPKKLAAFKKIDDILKPATKPITEVAKFVSHRQFKEMYDWMHDKERRQNRIFALIDKVDFFQVLVFWLLVVIGCGCFYFYFHNADSYLSYSKNGEHVTVLVDSIYFSIVAATTTGFGDIVPHGNFKFLAMGEVIFGLILLAIVTSKIVSVKQEMILQELYELSFNEKINQVRAALLLFRQNMSRLVNRVEEGIANQHELSEMHLIIQNLVDTLQDITVLHDRAVKSKIVAALDPMNTEIIINSIITSFEKLDRSLMTLTKRKKMWKNEQNIRIINEVISLQDELFIKLKESSLSDIDELRIPVTEYVNSIKKRIE